jgi:hypothetical protein
MKARVLIACFGQTTEAGFRNPGDPVPELERSPALRSLLAARHVRYEDREVPDPAPETPATPNVPDTAAVPADEPTPELQALANAAAAQLVQQGNKFTRREGRAGR